MMLENREKSTLTDECRGKNLTSYLHLVPRLKYITVYFFIA
jgi:hypothetical protein